jgi:SAM-dependent methyltransferase
MTMRWALRAAGRLPARASRPTALATPPRRAASAAVAAAAAAADDSPPAPAPAAVYASPLAYDIAFSFRDFAAEAAFLRAAYAAHCGGGAPRRALDVGCGPARHAGALAAGGGLQALGLDASPEMVAYATSRLARAGGPAAGAVELVRADFAAAGGLPLPGGPVDLAAAMLGTLAHCLDNGAALRCFRNLAAAVRPGGLLVVELAHPAELFSGALLAEEGPADAWEAEELAAEVGPSGPRRVLVEYGREADVFDPITQILRRTVGLSLFAPDGEMESSVVEVVPQRQFGAAELDLLARAAGFEVAALHGGLDAALAADDDEADTLVACLRRLRE